MVRGTAYLLVEGKLLSVKPIRLFGDPILRTPAQPVVDFDKELRQLVADLTETMLAAPGAGLAAPQIGVGLRVFAYCVDGVIGHLVNPSLALSEEQQDGEEGCLSFPGIQAEVERWIDITVSYQDLDGKEQVLTATEWLARIVQHELDHLEGVLFTDRLTAADKLRVKQLLLELEERYRARA